MPSHSGSIVQAVQIAQTPSCILPRVAGEDQRWGLERSTAVEPLELLEREVSVSKSAAALARVGAADESAGFRIDGDHVRTAEALRIAADDLVAAPS